jgi:hypothetical protein
MTWEMRTGGGRFVLPSHEACVSHGYMGSGMVVIPGLRPDFGGLVFLTFIEN